MRGAVGKRESQPDLDPYTPPKEASELTTELTPLEKNSLKVRINLNAITFG